MLEEYNFCFPVRTLQNKRFKLIPFNATLHAQKVFELTDGHAEMYAHTANGPYDSKDHFFSAFLESVSFADDGMLTFAIIDKTLPPSEEDEDGELVGMASLVDADPESRCVEIGHVRTLPPYMGRGVAKGASALLLTYALDPPEMGGLGLCRVEWHSSTANPASIAVATRLGFQVIGTVKYERLFEQGRKRGKIGNGKSLPPGSHEDDLWRDLVMYMMCWDDWASFGRQRAVGVSS